LNIKDNIQTTWWEDKDGNKVYPNFSYGIVVPKDAVYYHHIGCDVTHVTYRLDTQPNSKSILINTTNSTWSEDLVLGMVNSGDYGLKQAIIIVGIACERCLNALRFEYVDRACGYEIYSKEWELCNTECDFCKHLNPGKYVRVRFN